MVEWRDATAHQFRDHSHEEDPDKMSALERLTKFDAANPALKISLDSSLSKEPEIQALATKWQQELYTTLVDLRVRQVEELQKSSTTEFFVSAFAEKVKTLLPSICQTELDLAIANKQVEEAIPALQLQISNAIADTDRASTAKN